MGGHEEGHRLFAKGSLVEVRIDQEGFDGAWYVATVVNIPSETKKIRTSSSGKYLVKYQTLLADDNGSEPLVEHVDDVKFLRPLPPTETTDDQNHQHSFEVNDIVDAFHRDGWWTGVITRVVDNSKFAVHFHNPPDEIEFSSSVLRVHREWVDCKWVRAKKQGIREPKGGRCYQRKKRGRQHESVMQSTSTVARGDSMSDKNQSLPLEKCSVFWKRIESMEVFQVMPQKPHFRPLDNCEESVREGSAIVRGRLSELLSKKERQGELQEKSKEVEKEILKQKLEKSKMAEESCKKWKELEKQIIFDTLQNVMKDKEIAFLQTQLDVIGEALQSARCDFGRLVASPCSRNKGAKKILFYPRQHHVLVAHNGCQASIPPFSGRLGLYIEGSVSPIRIIVEGDSLNAPLMKGELALGLRVALLIVPIL
ncbi:hypothetical protein F0562_033118 [Nyssa sinensis]|uniref:Agenet domain-containing protein n=1 Tax=Nyssa sinensis TaxID=561372 RepID=A0A5J5ASP2_9ASTE|nr:hypothetical protein F0562_033118 [Nyssa sinensis]